MRAFKSISAVQINKELGLEGVALWQRNYYEHITHNGKKFKQHTSIYDNNPIKWANDENNPDKL